MIKIVNHHSP